MKSIKSIVTAALALVIVLFAVSNRELVTVQIWPLPYQVSLGLYAVILLAVLVGLFAGLILAWIVSSGRRRELRSVRRQIRDLEQSLARHRGDSGNTAND
ncbi:MAG: LapA family protein [Rhodospirillaceae bacterium]